MNYILLYTTRESPRPDSGRVEVEDVTQRIRGHRFVRGIGPQVPFRDAKLYSAQTGRFHVPVDDFDALVVAIGEEVISGPAPAADAVAPAAGAAAEPVTAPAATTPAAVVPVAEAELPPYQEMMAVLRGLFDLKAVLGTTTPKKADAEALYRRAAAAGQIPG